eukprot:gb/GECG01003678.1/.p1 GENE.gb/GECG01003678.1/~~gb/GECG01003678.1/.p1  ORF type:complete len:364 (+),score=49.72 gb/GECG01003678.1/:1-1092(+)
MSGGNNRLVAEEDTSSSPAPLQHGWTFWYIQKSALGDSKEQWTNEVQPLGSFDTVQGFWRLYGHIYRPNDIQEPVDLFLFKHGIKPMWEDPANAKGGRWVVRLRKGLASHYWESLILAMIGEQFDVGNEICGAAVNISPTRDSIAVWNRHADNADAITKIKETLQRVLDLPHWVPLKYKRFYEPPEGSKDNTTGLNEHQQQPARNENTDVRSFEGLLAGDDTSRNQSDRNAGGNQVFLRGFRRPQQQGDPNRPSQPGNMNPQSRGPHTATGPNKTGRGFGRGRYDVGNDNNKVTRPGSLALPSWRQRSDISSDEPQPEQQSYPPRSANTKAGGGFDNIGAWRRGSSEPSQQRQRYSSTGTDES